MSYNIQPLADQLRDKFATDTEDNVWVALKEAGRKLGINLDGEIDFLSYLESQLESDLWDYYYQEWEESYVGDLEDYDIEDEEELRETVFHLVSDCKVADEVESFLADHLADFVLHRMEALL